jgi:hypothetical protein
VRELFIVTVERNRSSFWNQWKPLGPTCDFRHIIKSRASNYGDGSTYWQSLMESYQHWYGDELLDVPIRILDQRIGYATSQSSPKCVAAVKARFQMWIKFRKEALGRYFSKIAIETVFQNPCC